MQKVEKIKFEILKSTFEIIIVRHDADKFHFFQRLF